MRAPAIVAVELPGSLEDVYLQALARLPEMSVIVYPDAKDESAHLRPVEPSDPFTEAVRTALEIDAEVVFVEPESGDRPHLPDTYPDTYSIRPSVWTGTSRLIAFIRSAVMKRSQRTPPAWPGSCGTDPLAQVLVVVSLNLLDPFWTPWRRRRTRPPDKPAEIRLLNPHPDCLTEITIEYPYLAGSLRDVSARLWSRTS